MNRALAERLRLIDFLVDKYGYVGRHHICDYFGVSTPQASRDLAAYRELAPGNIAFNESSRCYVKTETFQRVMP